jgi:Protein of unknown function (DUF998)
MTAVQNSQAAPATPAARTFSVRASSTRLLLGCAAASLPVWAVVSYSQAFTRQGFDVTRHPLSALSNGSLGWIQIANFLVVGSLVVAGSVGLRRALRGTPGGTWTPRLALVYGLGMISAGLLRMDPMDGFPVGTPAGQPTSMSWHSVGHMISGTIAFTAIIAACFVLGRHFSRVGERGLAVASRVAGVVFILGDGWAMTGGRYGALTLGVGVAVGMGWISLVAARLRGKVAVR